jgi:hypothetical protein
LEHKIARIHGEYKKKSNASNTQIPPDIWYYRRMCLNIHPNKCPLGGIYKEEKDIERNMLKEIKKTQTKDMIGL